MRCPACHGVGTIEVLPRSKQVTETRRLAARALRRKGYTHRQIAKMLGFKSKNAVEYLLTKKR